MAVVNTFLENPLFQIYAFYSSLLVLKMMFMSILTSGARKITKSFATPEDAEIFKGKVRTDDKVERIRRAHLNDLENIPIFFVVSLIYVLTNPSIFLATNLFRIYTIARFAHTLVYAIVVVPQPARGLAWTTGIVITGYMAIQNVFYFL